MSKSKAIQISIAGKIFSALLPVHIYEKIKAEADFHLYKSANKFMVELCCENMLPTKQTPLRFRELFEEEISHRIDFGCIIAGCWNKYLEKTGRPS